MVVNGGRWGGEQQVGGCDVQAVSDQGKRLGARRKENLRSSIRMVRLTRRRKKEEVGRTGLEKKIGAGRRAHTQERKHASIRRRRKKRGCKGWTVKSSWRRALVSRDQQRGERTGVGGRQKIVSSANRDKRGRGGRYGGNG